MPPKKTATIPKAMHDKLAKVVQNASVAGLKDIEQNISMLRSELLAQMEGVRSNATNEVKVADNMLQSLKNDIESVARSVSEDKPTLKAIADTMASLDEMQKSILDKQRDTFVLLQEYRDTLKDLKEALSPSKAAVEVEEPEDTVVVANATNANGTANTNVNATNANGTANTNAAKRNAKASGGAGCKMRKSVSFCNKKNC